MMQIEFFQDPQFILVCLCLAALRVYMEIMGMNFQKLPLTRAVFGRNSGNFHRAGLYISVGYIVLFA
ncbi:MAG: hypothetical protein WD025_01825, partial [Bacteriovoracaceae bacterium]